MVAAAIAVVSAIAGLAAGWTVCGTSGAPEFPPTVLRYAMVLPDSLALTDALGTPTAYAPDGSVFAYSSRAGLMLRYADRLDVVPVAGGRRGVGPFFSPDGRWLGFEVGAGVVKVPLGGRRAGRASVIRVPALASPGAATTPSATYGAARQRQHASADGGLGPRRTTARIRPARQWIG